MNKLSELKSYQSLYDFDLIALTETWLVEDVSDCELSLPGMHVLRHDRPSRGGGVLIYYRQNFICSVLCGSYLSCTDILWCQLQLHGKDRLLIGVIYRPPNSSCERDYFILESIREALSLRFSHVLIVGDFNSPSMFFNSASVDPFTSEMQEIICTHPLYNHTFQPTRFRFPSIPSLLDLILSNEELMIENVIYCPPLGKSDHALLCFHFVCYAFLL